LTLATGSGERRFEGTMRPLAYVRRVNWFVIAVAIVIASGGCGGGCSGCGITPIPGGFALAKRTVNAGQVRVSTSGIAKITADPAAVLGPLIGGATNGVIEFPAPVSCGGSTPLCCDDNGNAIPNCGPIDIDLNQRTGDSPRLVLAPGGAGNQLAVTIRARIKTVHNLAVTVIGQHCTIGIDTTKTGTQDLTVTTTVTFSQDTTTNVTGIAATGTAISNLDSGDLSWGGDFLCLAGNIIPISTVEGLLVSPIESAINGATCKTCMAVADCPQGATACTGGTCMIGSACQQELGIDGRMAASALFGSLSPGTTGALDLYEVAGGYAVTNEAGGGLSLGLLGGMEPGGTPRDMCGPAATEPAFVTTAVRSNYFSGNTRPDTNAAFDAAIGLHKSQIAQLAFGGYEGGLFCLTIGHNTVAQLTTDTISLLSRSLGKLVESNAPMALGLRPQSPPVITLGKNTFTTDANNMTTLADPLLDIKFTGMEIDFFASVDDQYIRVFTVVSDVHLPIGLQADAGGKLTPVLGQISDAFTNVSVKNSEAVSESPADLASLFPTLLNLVLPQLSGGLSAISLPNIGGLALSVNDITSVDDKDGDGVGDFLAIYANLVPVAMAAQHLETTFDITSIEEPSEAIAKSPAKWRANRPSAVTLALGARSPSGAPETRPLEFSLRIDEGSWTAWSKNPRPTLSPPTFWLPGVHHIEARARLAGDVESADLSPAVLAVPLGTALLPSVAAQPSVPKLNDPSTPPEKDFHGQSGATGCACNAGGGAGAAAPFGLVLLGLMVPWRRARKRGRAIAKSAMRLGPLVWLVAIACLPGCSCSSKPCGNADCMTGSLSGSIGRWTSIAGDDQRVMVATYDSQYGDLVVADVTDATKIAYKSVDGVPSDGTPQYDPSSWRGGIVEEGAKVGAWTSIALGDHKARVSYQDRDENVLKYAAEDGDGNWSSYVVDPGENGEKTGVFTSLVIDSDHHPVIAYMAVGGDDGMGHKTSELRIARAGAPEPSSNDWVITTVATAPASCAGSCTGGQSCVAGAAATDPQVCITPTSDCNPACASGDVCSMGACVTALADPMLDQLPTGTGLFAKLLVLTDGRLAIAFYDDARRALVLDVESAKGTGTFAETILDGNVAGADRGMWTSAVVGGDGTVHVAYQDALGDQLMYTTWNGAAGTPEIVDDGVRSGDRTHPVGAAASIYVVSGAPTIAYQDGMTSDVNVASKGATWTTAPLATGPLLDGFSIAATTGHGTPYLAWDTKDPNAMTISSLTVKTQ
jgi:hypothetical protein